MPTPESATHSSTNGIIPAGSQFNVSTGRSELHRVGQQIAQHLADLAWISAQNEIRFDAACAYVQADSRRVRPNPINRVNDEFVRGTRAQVQVQSASFNSGQLQGLRHELSQPIDFDVHSPEKVRPAVRILQGSGRQRFDQRFERGDRRL